MTQVLKGFLAAQSKLAHQHNHDGLISETIAEGEFPDAYGDMARNLNAMVKGHIEVQTGASPWWRRRCGPSHNAQRKLPRTSRQ